MCHRKYGECTDCPEIFLNNFKNVVNCRVDIREDIKRYREILSYASSKVDYSIGESIYMFPSDKKLKISSGTVGYINKVLVSDSGFNLGKNFKVNTSVPSLKTTIVHAPIPKFVHASFSMHEEEKILIEVTSGNQTSFSS